MPVVLLTASRDAGREGTERGLRGGDATTGDCSFHTFFRKVEIGSLDDVLDELVLVLVLVLRAFFGLWL
jgi:hypothetical protein